MKRTVTASTLRLSILKAYRSVWEKAPHKGQFVITQLLWDPLQARWKGRITAEFATSVLKSLDDDGLVKNIVAPDPSGRETLLSRITDKGLVFLAELETATLTRRIAWVGAVTGILALLAQVAGVLWGGQ